MAKSLARALLAVLVAGAGTMVSAAYGQSEANHYIGSVTYIDESAVEVSGRRGTFTGESSVTSDGRAVAKGSIQPGMPAQLDTDPEGRVLRLRVSGVVE